MSIISGFLKGKSREKPVDSLIYENSPRRRLVRDGSRFPSRLRHLSRRLGVPANRTTTCLQITSSEMSLCCLVSPETSPVSSRESQDVSGVLLDVSGES